MNYNCKYNEDESGTYILLNKREVKMAGYWPNIQPS